MRFIHTADWQIGKVFRRFGAHEEVFRRARLDAVEAIGRLALAEGVRHVLVAGDVYDSETPLPATRLAPLQRMRGFAGVTWHLLPGNHDPHRPRGLWHGLNGGDLPGNVRPRLAPEPAEIEPGVWLLPAPLCARSVRADLTAWMDGAATPEGAIRIGLAHGSVTDFTAEGEAGNPISPDRPARAGLAYLALGDWHRTRAINDRVWYAGTPEPDRMGGQEIGQALAVEAGPGPPQVRPVAVGRHRWLRLHARVDDEAGLRDLEARLLGLEQLSCLVLGLQLEGALSLRLRPRLAALLERVEAAVCHLEVDESGLRTRPTLADLEALALDGALAKAATALRARLEAPPSERERRLAENALVRLHALAGEPLA